MRKKTKELTITALLTALAITIPLVMPSIPPFKVVMPPFTATLASHVPLILSMFISPFSAVMTAIGSALGFLFAFPDPIVSVRAATHIFFTVAGAMMIRKKMNPVWTILVTLVLHSLSDMLTVYLAADFFHMSALLKGNTMGYVQAWIGIGTSVHHLVDFLIAYIILQPLSKTSLVSSKLHWGGKKRETVGSHK